ncbi:hypothetical protein ACU4GD_45060 [Cupriavidus basilensis]
MGTLGDQPVRLAARAQAGSERDSVHGEYSVGRAGGVRLLAGEYENGAFLMEESNDGTHVTGNWEGAPSTAPAWSMATGPTPSTRPSCCPS